MPFYSIELYNKWTMWGNVNIKSKIMIQFVLYLWAPNSFRYKLSKYLWFLFQETGFILSHSHNNYVMNIKWTVNWLENCRINERINQNLHLKYYAKNHKKIRDFLDLCPQTHNGPALLKKTYSNHIFDKGKKIRE